MRMKLQSKLGDLLGVKTYLFKGLQSVRGGHGTAALRPQMILGPGVYTVFDLHKMDVPLFWKELAKVTDLGSRWTCCRWRWTLPVPPPPTPLSTSQNIPEIGFLRPYKLPLFLEEKRKTA
eukprot:1159556-Pelagomonas_calceolata.AAC.1